MTPQEIAEYKARWKSNSWSCFVDPDADVWSKDWCRRYVPREDWSFDKFARQDDWHKVLFHFQTDMMAFKAAYNLEHKTQI